MTALDDVRFWMQVVEDSRRTLLCRPELVDKVQAKLTEIGAAGTFNVLESAHVPAGHIIVVDHNTIEASTRQAIQNARYRP